MKDANIVILDGPAAALNAEGELGVHAAIDALVREKTVIVIAHRLSTIVVAGRIQVLDHGRLVQQGRHTELLAQEGHHAAMWAAQLRAEAWHA